MKPAERAATTYNAAADHYEKPALAFWNRYGRRTIERLALSQGAVVLDVGCGAGASVLPAAEAVGSSGRVQGVDLAENLLALARAKAEQRGLRNVEFHCGDMRELARFGSDFDAVVSVFSIFFVPDIPHVIRDLWQRVRPGGKLAITTWGPQMFEPVNSIWWSSVEQERPDLVAAFNPWERVNSVETLRRALMEAGVTESEVMMEAGAQAFESHEDIWSVVLGSGYRWTLEQMEPQSARRVREAFAAETRARDVRSMHTNVIYATAAKPR